MKRRVTAEEALKLVVPSGSEHPGAHETEGEDLSSEDEEFSSEDEELSSEDEVVFALKSDPFR